MGKEVSYKIRKDATFTEVLTAIINCQKNVGGKPISEWVDFPLCKTTFKRYTEQELETLLDVFFCNGLSHPINEAMLVYSSYEGFLSIIPVHTNNDYHHNSYFNLIDNMGPEDEDGIEQYTKDIFALWQKLLIL